jgi:hypothetical protein
VCQEPDSGEKQRAQRVPGVRPEPLEQGWDLWLERRPGWALPRGCRSWAEQQDSLGAARRAEEEHSVATLDLVPRVSEVRHRVLRLGMVPHPVGGPSAALAVLAEPEGGPWQRAFETRSRVS